MINKRTAARVAVSALALTLVLRAEAQQKQMADEIVAVVGNSMILYSDVMETSKNLIEAQKARGYSSDTDPFTESLEMLMTQKLLANQARVDSLKINAPMVVSKAHQAVQALVAEAGSVAALEKEYNRNIHEITKNYQLMAEEMALASSMEREVEGKITITPAEVKKFYKQMRDSLPVIPEQVVYAQIILYPTAIDAATLTAKTQLLKIRERIMNGEDFATLAIMYSDDPGSAINGGEYDYSDPDNYDPAFGDALKALNPGNISELVETPYGVHIIQLIDKKGSLVKFRHILITPKIPGSEIAKLTERLDSILTLVRTDKITFEQAVEQYSEDKNTKFSKGVVSNTTMIRELKDGSDKFFRDNVPPMDYPHLNGLKVGEISRPYQAMDFNNKPCVKAVTLKQVIPSHDASLEGDYAIVETFAMAYKKNNLIQQWVSKKLETTYVNIAPAYRKLNFSNKSWLK